MVAGKLMLVTGGGSGIGAEVCRQGSAEGARVIVADVNAVQAARVHSALPEPHLHMVAQVDVSNAAAVDDLFASIELRYPGEVPTLLAHSAGVIRNLEGIEGCTEDVFDTTINVNVKGTYLVNRKLALLLRAKGLSGSIVNVSSVSSAGLWQAPAYSASKGAINSFSKALGKEMGVHGIRVNAVAPGTIDTEFGFGALEDCASEAQRSVLRSQQKQTPIPLGRLGSPADVANMIVFLLSDKASYITSSVFDVNGGALDQPGRSL